jgi:hypothetical protein
MWGVGTGWVLWLARSTVAMMAGQHWLVARHYSLHAEIVGPACTVHNTFARHAKLEGQEPCASPLITTMAIASATTLAIQRHITFDLPRDVINTMLRNLFAR